MENTQTETATPVSTPAPTAEPTSTKDIILQSIDGMEGVDINNLDDATDDPDVDEAPVEEAPKPKKLSAEEKAAKEKADEKALDDELEGLDKPAKGKKENFIPHSRTKEMVKRAEKKAEARVRAEIEAARKAEAEKEAPNKKRTDEALQLADLLEKDPDRFLEVLPIIHPQFKERLTPKQQKAVERAQEQLGEERPGPDAKDAAGNPAYTPEGWAKYESWLERRAVAKAKEEMRQEFEKEYGPIRDKHKAEETVEALKPRLRAQVQRAQTRYGSELFNPNQEAISKKLEENKNDPFYTFEDACADVLVPLMRADASKIRQETLDELEERPAAAETTARQAVVPGSTREPKSSHDIIMEIARGLK